MSFSSGAYVGSHSTESHGRAASALRLALLVWIGPLSSASTTRPALATRRRAAGPVEPHQQGDEIGGALGPAGADDQLAARGSSTPRSARFPARPGASARRSAP